jgi:hypothetical protein
MVVSDGGNEEGRLDRRAKVELFEEIRREYQFGVGTIKGTARKLGVHRREEMYRARLSQKPLQRAS